jgi:hypothetical protein
MTCFRFPKRRRRTDPKKRKPSYRDRILQTGSTYTNRDYTEMSTTKERAVLLARHPCLQTFHGVWTRYLNFLVRPFERFPPYSHWRLVLTAEIPSISPGSLTRSLPKESRTIELQVPVPSEEETPTVGSFDGLFPIQTAAFPDLLYLGTTTMSDAEISLLGEFIVEFMRCEGTSGRYHGIFRNCQHFVGLLCSFLCPSAPLPARSDQTMFGANRWFKGVKWDFTFRSREARDFVVRRIREERERVRREINGLPPEKYRWYKFGGSI